MPNQPVALPKIRQSVKYSYEIDPGGDRAIGKVQPGSCEARSRVFRNFPEAALAHFRLTNRIDGVRICVDSFTPRRG